MTRMPSARSFVCAAALMIGLGSIAQADSTFPKPVLDFKGRVSFASTNRGEAIAAGTEVVASGSDFVAGQTVTLQRGQTVLGSGVADAEGKVSISFKVPEDADLGQHPVVLFAENPSVTSIATLKVSPVLAIAGAEKFAISTAKATRGLYQAAYGDSSKAVFVTSAVGRPPVKQSELLKFDAESLEIVARVTPGAAPARQNGDDGGVFAVYGVDVDDANGNVWVTVTRQNTIAVYKQDDLSLVKQFEPGAVSHARDVIVDEARGRAYISAARSNAIEVFDTKTLEKVGTVEIASAMRGGEFGTMSLAIDAEGGKLYTVSLGTPEAAEINLDTLAVDRILALPGAVSAAGVAVDPQSRRLFVASQGSDNLLIVDLASGEVFKDIPVGAGALNVVFEPVSKQVVVSNRGAHTFTMLTTDGEVIANLDAGSLPNHSSVDGNGNIWAVNKSSGEDDPKGDLLWRIAPAK